MIPRWSHCYPVFHWTDQKIMIHAFICILGLLLLPLLQLKMQQAGHNLSLELIKEELKDLQCQVYVTVEGKVHRIISKTSPLQSKLFRLFNLDVLCKELGIQPP